MMICQTCGSEYPQPKTANCAACGSVDSLVERPKVGRFDLGDLECNGLGRYIPVRNFDFLSFATAIYHDKPQAHQTPFLLPALYGGELTQADGPYEALFVLEDPSISETQKYWTAQCKTATEAIQQHRQVFLQWAYEPDSYPIILFSSFSATGNAFFSRFYVTDIWKDRKPTSDEEKTYWRKKLRIELREVQTKRIIFVGDEALKGKKLIEPGTVHTHYVPHPNRHGMTKQQYRSEVVDLWKDIKTHP